MRFIYIFILCVARIALGSIPEPILNSQQALLIDATTQQVLYEKNADQQVPPSSMSKMMTVYLIFKALAEKKIHMDTRYQVSEKAWRKGGSKMFVKVKDAVTVNDLLRGVIVQSGNDAAITLAEGYAGSEEAFAQQMTQVAHEIGAVHSNFVNATGWPDPEHLSTMKDLALIALKTIKNYPQYYGMYGEKEFTYNTIKQMNRNPLLYVDIGADGLKTGHTEAGGYGVVASSVQEGRRLILAINGAKTMKQRTLDAQVLMRYGFSAFASPCIFKAGEVIDEVPTWLGDKDKVALTVHEDIFVTLPRDQLSQIKIELNYKSPLKAPLHKGQNVGQGIITLPSGKVHTVPLWTQQAVDKAAVWQRMGMIIRHLFKS